MNRPLFGRLLGCAIGGAAGFLATEACWSRGFPSLALVGLGVGLGARMFARSRSRLAALVVGVVALVAPVVYLWLHHDTLVYRTFADRLVDLPPALLVQLLASAAIACLLGLGPIARRGHPNTKQQANGAPSGAGG